MYACGRWLMTLALLGAGGTVGRGAEPPDVAVDALTKLGGKVTRDAAAPGKPVLAVDLSLSQVTDEGLGHFQALTNLQTLSLIGTRVTDAGMVKVATTSVNSIP